MCSLPVPPGPGLVDFKTLKPITIPVSHRIPLYSLGQITSGHGH